MGGAGGPSSLFSASAFGASGFRSIGRKHVGLRQSLAVAQGASRHGHSRLLAQLFQNVLPVVAGVLAGEAGKGLGQDVVMVQRLQARLARNVQPQPVHQVDILGFQRRRVRTDVKSVHLEIGIDDLKNKLPFGLRHRLPGMSEIEGLFLGAHLARKSGDHRRGFQIVRRLHNRRPGIARRHNQQRNVFAEAFGHRYGAGK